MLNVMVYNGGVGLDDNRLNLGNCSTVTAIKNNSYLSNVREADKEINMSCNAGVATTTLGGIDCWYMPEGIANILSMYELEQLDPITYDSWDG